MARFRRVATAGRSIPLDAHHRTPLPTDEPLQAVYLDCIIDSTRVLILSISPDIELFYPFVRP